MVQSTMSFRPIKNPSKAQIRDCIGRSRHKAARMITDSRTGDIWIWPAEDATHAEAASNIGIPYDLPPGAGTIITD